MNFKIGGKHDRPKGNEETKKLRNQILKLMNMNRETIQENLEALTPKERIDLYIKLMGIDIR